MAQAAYPPAALLACSWIFRAGRTVGRPGERSVATRAASRLAAVGRVKPLAEEAGLKLEVALAAEPVPMRIGAWTLSVKPDGNPPVEWLAYEREGRRMDSVLIVDDNQDLLDVHAEVLLTLGHLQVHKARSALEALRMYESVDPALVILDEGLADMCGSELLRRLRQANSRARRPALFVTGARCTVQCLPGDVVLEKPVEMQRLLDAVEALVPEAKPA